MSIESPAARLLLPSIEFPTSPLPKLAVLPLLFYRETPICEKYCPVEIYD
jgi:hypothetical protein